MLIAYIQPIEIPLFENIHGIKKYHKKKNFFQNTNTILVTPQNQSWQFKRLSFFGHF